MKKYFYSLALLVFCSWMPIDFLDDLQTKFDRYVEKNPSVKISLAFNQPSYAPGDTAFFSAMYVDEALHGVKGSHVVTLDVVAPNGRVVQRIKFKVQQGQGHNQIALKKDLQAGEYKLIAYTDWMKNFGSSWFYQKKINISSRKQLIAVEKKISNQLMFFPEGGQCVRGISNKIAITGSPAQALTIVDHQDAEVTKVVLDASGFGSVTLIPQTGQKYFAQTAEGKRISLPTVQDDGIGVQVDSQDPHVARLTVPAQSKYSNQEVYAVVCSRGKILLKREVAVSADQAFRLQIPAKDEIQAFYQLYLLDPKGQVLAERILMPMLTETVEAKIQFPADANQRENVSGKIRVLDKLGNPLKSDLSITVYQSQLFNQSVAGNDLYLADLPAVMARAEQTDVDFRGTINDFLITQRWNRLNWESILSDKPVVNSFPFQSQIKLTGKVISKKTGQPAPDSTAVLAYLQKNTVGYEAYTRKGRFEMPFLFDFWGDDQVFCSLQSKSKDVTDNYDIIIEHDTVNFIEPWVTNANVEAPAYGEYAFSKNLVTNSYSFFSNGQAASGEYRSANAIFEEEFMGADFTVNMADYVLFPKMEDLLREVVPFVKHRKKGEENSIRMSARVETTSKKYKDDPLYIIDGTMTRNTNFFLGIKPDQLMFIKVLNNPNKLSHLGKLGENGVIFVESKKGDLAKSLPAENLFPVVGLCEIVEFPEANPAAKDRTRVPDLRSTLYWNPLVKTDAAGRADVSFFSSDDVGPLKIVVRGLTADNRPVYAEQIIQVSFDTAQK
ncbi:MAG: hypothetical protein ACOYXT_26140 [Bacteroidota bacterium]